ncbi:hypothetical protein, partial [Mesorhizobium sp. M1A.F.Ca.IN.020.06.1.1]|uniref:hypothetical protein n=1 Tax=Mesorhizobium sp. M1A.F.Ca.IN.020.06.1.1 TaxID=2496765 RepID=UPI0019D44800
VGGPDGFIAYAYRSAAEQDFVEMAGKDTAQTPSEGHKDLKSVGARLHPSGDLSAMETHGAR